MTLIVALIMSYLVCWTPLHLFHLLTAFEYRMNMDACTAFEHVYNGYVDARIIKYFNMETLTFQADMVQLSTESNSIFFPWSRIQNETLRSCQQNETDFTV